MKICMKKIMNLMEMKRTKCNLSILLNIHLLKLFEAYEINIKFNYLILIKKIIKFIKIKIII